MSTESELIVQLNCIDMYFHKEQNIVQDVKISSKPKVHSCISITLPATQHTLVNIFYNYIS